MRRADNTITIFAIIVVIAVIVGIIVLAFGPADREEDPEPTVNVQTEPPQTPEPTPEVIATPTPIQTPQPTPQPTPEVVVTEEPVYVVDASGSFSSDTGTYLNVKADWTATSQHGNTAYLTIKLSVVHYSFYTDALPGSIVMTVGDEVINLGSPSISYDGSDQKITEIASTKVEVPVGATVPITVEWHYRGTYGGVELETITLSGSAYIG